MGGSNVGYRYALNVVGRVYEKASGRFASREAAKGFVTREREKQLIRIRARVTPVKVKPRRIRVPRVLGRWVEFTYEYGWEVSRKEYGLFEVRYYRRVIRGEEESMLEKLKGDADVEAESQRKGRLFFKGAGWKEVDKPGRDGVVKSEKGKGGGR